MASKEEKDHATKPQTTADTPMLTLYVRNLPEKLNRDKARRSLYALFSRVGTVVDVAVPRKNATRGQAWVVFADVEAASKAKEAMQGFQFYERPMDVHFAAAPSDVEAMARGQPVHRERVAAKRRASAPTTAPASAGAGGAGGASGAKKARVEDSVSVSVSTDPTTALRVTFPPNAAESVVRSALSSLAGFKDARFVPNKGTCVADFATVAHAKAALTAVPTLRLPSVAGDLAAAYAVVGSSSS